MRMDEVRQQLNCKTSFYSLPTDVFKSIAEPFCRVQVNSVVMDNRLEGNDMIDGYGLGESAWQPAQESHDAANDNEDDALAELGNADRTSFRI